MGFIERNSCYGRCPLDNISDKPALTLTHTCRKHVSQLVLFYRLKCFHWLIGNKSILDDEVYDHQTGVLFIFCSYFVLVDYFRLV